MSSWTCQPLRSVPCFSESFIMPWHLQSHGGYLFHLAPGRSECDSKNAIFNLVLLFGILRSSHDNALRWMPQDLTDDKSTLVQVMAWCRQATSHYLRQCWFSSLSPSSVARPQCDLSLTRRTRSCVIRNWTFPIDMKFDKQLTGSAAAMAVKFQNDTIVITTNLAARDFMRFDGKTSYCLVNRGPE